MVSDSKIHFIVIERTQFAVKSSGHSYRNAAPLPKQFKITQEALVFRIRLAFGIEGIELMTEFLSKRTILFKTLPGING